MRAQGIYDAIVVGGRCAGSTLALALAERGWDVVVVDRAPIRGEVVSTHLLYPNTVANLDRLGVLDRLRARHDLPFLASRFRAFGHEIVGTYTPIEGYDRAICPRRSILDPALVEAAAAAGASYRIGERVVGLVGAGTAEDPVSGVELASGERLRAPWVFGADGRGSKVAAQLGIPKEREGAGEISVSFAYWRGIPDDGDSVIEIEEGRVFVHMAVEDGLRLVQAMGSPELARGGAAERERNYLEALALSETLPAHTFARAEMASPVTDAPEPLLRGFFRRPNGPGWALVGDACHFKHPITAQGIGDAIEQALFVADALSGPSPSLDGYAGWRDEHAAEHYDWSLSWGKLPTRERTEPIFRGVAADERAGQDLRDAFERLVEPSRAFSRERLQRWFAAAPG